MSQNTAGLGLDQVRALIAAEGAAHAGQWPHTSSTAWGNDLASGYPGSATDDSGSR